MKMVSKFSILYVDNGRILFLAETWIADEKRAQPESISYRQAYDSLTCNSKAYYDNKSPDWVLSVAPTIATAAFCQGS